MDITGLAGVAVLALAKQLLDLFRYANNRQWNGVLTIVAAWIVGSITVLMVSFTALGQGDIFGITLSNQGIYGRVVIGMIVGSTTGLTHDLFKAVNNKSNYEKPPLFPGLVHETPQLETVSVPAQEIVVDTTPKGSSDA